jgi:NAD(P)H-nitrite reductase large subunit
MVLLTASYAIVPQMQGRLTTPKELKVLADFNVFI